METNAITTANPASPATWEELGHWCAIQTNDLKAVVMAFAQRTIAMGHAVLLFSERPEIMAEIEKANEKRRGAPWKPYNYVAFQLAERFPALPSARHLGDCARAAHEARSRGELETILQGKQINIRQYLGWTQATVEVGSGVHAPAPRDLEATEFVPTESDYNSGQISRPIKVLPLDEFSRRYVRMFEQFARISEEVIQVQPRGNFKLSDEQRAKVHALRKTINKSLRYLNLKLIEEQSK